MQIQQYRMWNDWTESSFAVKISEDSKLNMSQQCALAVKNDNMKSIASRLRKVITSLYLPLPEPLLEHCGLFLVTRC